MCKYNKGVFIEELAAGQPGMFTLEGLHERDLNVGPFTTKDARSNRQTVLAYSLSG